MQHDGGVLIVFAVQGVGLGRRVFAEGRAIDAQVADRVAVVHVEVGPIDGSQSLVVDGLRGDGGEQRVLRKG